MTPKVPSPNGLSGFFKVGDFLLGSAPFLVYEGTQTYLGAKVGTRATLRAQLGTRSYLGRVVAPFTDASLLRVPLQVGIGL